MTPAPKVQTHSVFDSESLKRQQQEALAEAQRQLQKDIFCEQMETCRVVREGHLDDWDAQQGRVKLTDDFVAEVQKICPFIKVVPWQISEASSERKGLGRKITKTRAFMWYRNNPTNGEEMPPYVGGCLWPLVAEFDILIQKQIVAPVVNEKTGFLERNIEGPPLDPTKYDISKPVFEGEGLLLSNAEQYIRSPADRIPGWRSVLASLVNNGAATVSQVERFFLPADRLSWAVQMGRRSSRDLKGF